MPLCLKYFGKNNHTMAMISNNQDVIIKTDPSIFIEEHKLNFENDKTDILSWISQNFIKDVGICIEKKITDPYAFIVEHSSEMPLCLKYFGGGNHNKIYP